MGIINRKLFFICDCHCLIYVVKEIKDCIRVLILSLSVEGGESFCKEKNHVFVILYSNMAINQIKLVI